MRNICPKFLQWFFDEYLLSFKKKSPKTTQNALSSIYGYYINSSPASPDDDASSDSQCLARWHKSLEVDPNKRVTSALDPRSSLRNGQVFSSRFLSMPFQKRQGWIPEMSRSNMIFMRWYWDESSPFPLEKKGNQGCSCQKKRKDLGSGQWLVNHQPHSITIV